jgi:predicted transcriptional regulator
MDKEVNKTQIISKNEENPKLSEFDFITDKPYLVYLIKKLERIGGAIHIITNTLPQEEPLRKSIREECLLLIKNSLLREMNKNGGTPLETGIAHCISLLNIGRSSLLISEMNAEILRDEFLALLPIMQGLYRGERDQISFAKNGLIIPLPLPEEGVGGGRVSLKGQSGVSDVFYKSAGKNQKAKINLHTKPIRQNDSTREKMIVDIVKNKGEVSIKDITAFIRGVSGKTIQRDLLYLVSKGVLKKSGERRWSKYSLR